MGRRSAMNMKMVLPTVSWVAVMRLLKKGPSGILGIDAATKALLGCSALPNTPSLRYTDHAYSPEIGGHPGARRPKVAPGAALLSCASRPHTDSFRIHHVVNQEALQLVLDNQADLADDILYESFECEESLNCSFDMIIRDGDRLLHDVEAASASVMSSCSSRLSNCTAGSSRTAFSAAHTAFSRSSVDSEEGNYSTASSASFQVTPGRQYSCSSSDSYSQYSANLSAGLDYSADTDGMSEISANSCDESDCCGHRTAGHSFAAQADGIAVGQGHADRACGEDDVDARHARDAGAHNDDDDDEDEHVMHDDEAMMDADAAMVAETCYSEDPLLDFEESIEELVRCHELIGQHDELHALYCRYIQLNPPTLHPTIALAFFQVLQRLEA
ncbi:hypothetical protein GOP47_0006850 [Adiantum capillus-veneris]|uniref:Transcription repressor n=1 Tax=Adiantum capillus-veneris TaxID=13818 RepID=A0A9D4ZKU1_ADICA|nr:hypothetical protein GOP47_0006850 [Adiantum capillus-veneris]